MKPRILMAFAFTAAACLFLGSNLGAGDKKEKEKPKKAEDIVVNGELITADLKDKVRVNSYCKTFTFKMEKDKTYQIELASAAFRPWLRLENSDGGEIATDWAKNVKGNAVIVHRAPKTADHTIVVTALTANNVGKFTLTVKELGGDVGKPIDLKFDKGEAKFTGNLIQADPRYKGQKIHKMFILPMEAGKTYQIDHKSGDFDCYLYLEDPDGKVLAEDDDGGGGLDSRILHKAGKAGNYRIVATSLAGNQTGRFTLTVGSTGDKDK
jgi:hypothetical protein